MARTSVFIGSRDCSLTMVITHCSAVTALSDLRMIRSMIALESREAPISRASSLSIESSSSARVRRKFSFCRASSSTAVTGASPGGVFDEKA